METTVLIALGSNRRHGRHGPPVRVVAAAIAELAARGLTITARSAIIATDPIGPGTRRFANAAIAVTTGLPLPALLGLLKSVERSFGRRPGRRWGDRVLDLDIIGAGDTVTPKWRTARAGLIVPHRSLAERRFVLDPLLVVAPRWRHPVLHLSVRQLRARAMRPMPRRHGDGRAGP